MHRNQDILRKTQNEHIMKNIPTQTLPPVAGIPPVIDIDNLRRTYGMGESVVQALDGVSLTVRTGEFVAIMGPSGSGKSTMMNIVGLLDEPDEGTYNLDGDDVSYLRGRELTMIRNRKIGFVFQSFNLRPTMSALANVELPMAYAGVSRKERRERAELALEMVGLSGRAKHHPHQLSGGQQQRVAVARSLVNAPALILADEPTGNLDSKSTNDVLDVFSEINRSGRTVVLITHEDDVAARANRVVEMRDGRITSDSAGINGPFIPTEPDPVLEEALEAKRIETTMEVTG
jgi:putative ABC transport system ATP-binding protein